MKIRNVVLTLISMLVIIDIADAQIGGPSAGTSICHCGEEQSSGGTYLYVVTGDDCCKNAYGGAINFVWEEQYPGVWGSTPEHQHNISGSEAQDACCD